MLADLSNYLKDDIFFTVLDLQALQEIWGNEISNPIKTNTKKINKKKINNQKSIKIVLYLKTKSSFISSK